MSDEEGLKRAYHTDKGIFVLGSRMYVAGTKSVHDAKDGILRTPFHGNGRSVRRDQDARKTLMDHPEVDSRSGHCLGASTALKLQTDYKQVRNTRVYGAPVIDITPHIGPAERIMIVTGAMVTPILLWISKLAVHLILQN